MQELYTIVDTSRTTPSLDPELFPGSLTGLGSSTPVGAPGDDPIAAALPVPEVAPARRRRRCYTITAMVASSSWREPGRMFPAKSLELFFDYTCPFAYLASTQARALAARMGVELTYRPILLGGVFRAVGTAQNLSETLGPAKAAHNAADMQRWARRFGVPLRMPPGHPMRSVEALRATLATGIDPKVIDGFYRAYWVEGRDVATREVVASVLEAAGHDPARVLAAASSQAIKDDLRARTDDAIARGVFGVPSFVVDGEHLYWGQDRMAFVEGVFDAPPRAAPASSPRTLEFHWDFSSPFAYLASTQIEGLAARTGARVVWHPILLGGLFRSIGTPDVPLATFSPAKQRFVARDLERWAGRWGVPYRFPSKFPIRSVAALRTWLALPEEHRGRFRENVFRAYWAEDRDIEDDDVLASCVGAPDDVVRAALAKRDGDEVKAQLRASTEAAAARGVFGVPTFVVDGELFWGQDRLDLVEDALTAATSA
jgi:2-hydroxychromene-2-carboxylate isomerase